MTDQQARILARFAENPSDASAFDEAVDVLVETSDWERLLDCFEARVEELTRRDEERHWRRCVDGLERILNRLAEPAERARLLCATAAIWEEELERPDQALLGYQAAFRLDRTQDRAIEEARRIQAGQGNWLMVARSYQLQLQVQREPTAKAALLAEAASVHRTKLGDVSAADRMLAEARAIDPEVAEPSDEPVQAPEGWQERLEELESRLYGTRGTDRADLLYTIAGILVDEPGDAATAEPYIVEAARLHPHSPSGLRTVARYHLLREEFEQYQQTLEKVASGKGPLETRSSVLVELARFRASQNDPEGGDAALRWALDLAPRAPEVLGLAQERYRVSGDWGALTTALERSIEGRTRGSHATETHIALGEIYWRELEQLDEAERHFKRVRLSDGRNQQMLRFYVDFYGRRADWGRVLSNLRTLRTAAGSEDEKIALAAHMAEIAEEELGDLDGAIDIWTSARGEHPDSSRASTELRRLLRKGEKWNRLVDLLKADAAALPGDAVPDKIGLLTEMAHLYRDHFHLPVLVGNAFGQILELDPNHEEANQVLTDRFTKAGRWTDLVGLLENRLGATDDPLGKARILHQIAEVSAESLNDPRAAARAYEAALELRPEDAVAIEALKSIYATADPHALFALRRRELALLSEARRVAAIGELVVMAEQIEVEDATIIELLEELLELAPEGEDSAAKLDALYRSENRWTELIEFSEARLERAESPSAESIRALAEVLAEHAPDPEAEERLWRQLVALDGDDGEAAERLASSLVAAESWDELEVFAGERDDWSILIGPLESAAQGSEDAQLWRHVARVKSERVDDRAGQIAALERAWDLDQSDLSALTELENAQAFVGDHQGRVDTLRDLIERLPADEAKEVSLQLASVLDDELEKHEEAYEVLNAVYFEDPEDPTVLRRTLDSAKRAGTVPELMASLKREAAGMAAGETRRALYFAIVELGEGAADSPLDAVDYLERIRAEDPYDPELVTRLSEVYSRTERWERLAELLTEVLEEFPQEHQEGAAIRLVEVRAAYLRTEEHPIEALESLGVVAPSASVLRALRERLVEAEVWAPAAEVADAEVQASTNAAAARDAAFAAADALTYVDPTAAASRFAQIVVGAPRSETASESATRLLALAVQLEDPASWAAAAEPALEAHERWVDLADALEVQETAEPNNERLARLAELHAHRLDDPGVALRCLLRMGANARKEDRARAVEIARKLGDLPALVESWRSHAASEVSVGFLSDLAQVLDEDLGAPDEARHVWRRAYEADPTSGLAVEALERLNRSLDADEDLADHLISSAENAPPTEKAARLREAAEILSRREGRETEAVPLFERALELSPRDLQSYEGLERLYRALYDDESLLDLLKRKIATFADRPDVMAGGLTTFGTAVVERGGGARVALHAYRKALTAVPNHRATIDALAKLHHSSGGALSEEDRAEIGETVRMGLSTFEDHHALISFVEAGIERASEAEAAVLHREAANLSSELLDDAQRAFHHWGQTLRSGDRSADAVREFAALGRGLSSSGDVIRQFEDVLGSHPEALDVRLELIEIYLEAGDRENAIRHLEIDALDRPREMQTVLRLEALYREMGASGDTAALLMRKARGLPSEQAAEALREAVGLYRGVLGDEEREADALLRLHRLEPDDNVGLRLEELLDRLQRWEELSALLSARAHGIDGPAGNDIRLRRAEILEVYVGDMPRAIAAYRAVLEHQADEPSALERLDAIYAELRMSRERASILQLRIPVVPDAERPEITTALARVAAFELGEPDAGVGLLRNALVENPTFGPAIEVLEMLALGDFFSEGALEILVSTHRQTGAFEDAIRVLSAAAASGPRGSRVRLLEQAREIYEDDVRDPDGAFAVALEAVRASQGNTSVVADAVRLSEGVNGWTRLATALEDVADLNPDPGSRTELLLLLGEILNEKLGRPKDAEEAYQKVVEADPHQLDALRALDGIYSSSGQSGAHTAVVDALLETVNDEGQRLALLRRSAALHESEDADLDKTIARYESILSADPTDAAALARMRTLIRRTEDWPRLVAHLGRMLDTESSAVGRAPLLLETASLRAVALEEPDAALEPLVELLSTDPGNAQGRRLAETLLADNRCDPEDTLPLLGTLTAIYRSNEEWHELSDALAMLASRAPVEVAGPKWYELADVLENKLGEREHALDAYGHLLRAEPSNQLAFDSMVRISLEEWTWDSFLGTAMAVALSEGTEADTRARLLGEVAALSMEWTGDEDRALGALEELAADSPDDAVVRADLERIYHRRRDWASLTRLYSGLAADGDDATAGVFLRRAAAIQADFAGDVSRAADLLTAAAALDDPQHAETLALQVTVLSQVKRWDSLAQILRDLIDSDVDPETRDAAAWELAHLRLNHLSDPPGAVSLLVPLLDSSIMGAPAFELAAQLLRSFVGQDPDPLAIDLAESLEPRARDAGRWGVVVDVLSIRSRAAENPVDSARALIDVANVQRRLARPRAEFAALRTALAFQPDSLELKNRLRAVASQNGDIGSYRSALQDAAGTPRTESAAALMMEAAYVAEHEEKDPLLATALLRAIVDVRPADREAVAELERVSEVTGDFEALALALRSRLVLAGTEEERVSLLERLVEVTSADEDLDAQLDLLADLAASSPSRENVEALEDAARRNGDSRRLEQALARRAEWGERAAIEELSELRVTEFGDYDGAIAVWRDHVAASGEDLGASRALSELYRETDREAELADALDRISRATDDTEERLAAWEEGGRLRLHTLKQPVAALKLFGELASARPESKPAREGLAALLEIEETSGGAARALEPLAELDGDSERRLELLDVILAHSSRPEVQVDLCQRMSTIAAEKLDDADRAFEFALLALEFQPTNPVALLRMRNAALEADRVTELASELEERAASCRPAEAALLFRLAGDLHRAQLDDAGAAMAAYQRVLELAPQDEEAASAFAAVAVAHKAFNVQADVMEARLESLNGSQGAAVALELARLCEYELEDAQRAARTYRRVMEFDPKSTDAVDGIERLAVRSDATPETRAALLEALADSNNEDRLLAFIEGAVEHAEGPEKSQMLLRQAAVLEGRDPTNSSKAYVDAMVADLSNREAFLGACRTASDPDTVKQLVGVARASLKTLRRPADQHERLAALAAVAGKVLRDSEITESLLREALELEPESVEIVDDLVALLLENRRDADALSTLADAAANASQPAIRARYHRRRVELADGSDGAVLIDALRDGVVAPDIVQAIPARTYEDLDWKAAVEALDAAGENVRGEGQELLLLTVAEICAPPDRDPGLAAERLTEHYHESGEVESATRAIEILAQAKRAVVLRDAARALSATVPPEIGIAMLMASATLDDEEGEGAEAAKSYRQILAIEPAHQVARGRFEAISLGLDDVASVVELLRDDLARDVTHAAEIHRKIATLARERMEDLELAEEHLAAALAVQPDDVQPLEALVEFYESTERPDDADALIRSRLHTAVGSSRRAKLLRLHAQLLRARGDESEAILRLEEAFEEAPSDDLLAELSDHYEASEDWTSLQACLYRAASGAPPERAAPIWIQLADLAETKLEDLDLSRTALEEALASGTVNETITGRLLAFYEDGADSETDEVIVRALDACELNANRDGIAQVQYLRGQVAELRDDSTAALRAYEASYALSTSYLPNLQRLAELYYRAERYADALKTLRSALLHQLELPTDADRVRLFLRLGELRFREGDESRAKDMYRRVLSLDSDNDEALGAIDAIDEGRPLFS